jgi:hypothetical protein
LRCKNLAKTRDWVGSNLQLVTAPFSRFFIANTLHHRLQAVARSVTASSQRENTRYTLRSFARYILLGCSLSDTSKSPLGSVCDALSAGKSAENREFASFRAGFKTSIGLQTNRISREQL